MGRGRGHLQPPDVLLRSGNKLEGTDDIRLARIIADRQ